MAAVARAASRPRPAIRSTGAIRRSTTEAALERELHRVFDICHGCRRCFSLCQSFPILFDAIDASPTLELDGVDKRVYWQVVENCYLCDMCYMTKCPYVPPHPWNVDFPHLMLRAKAVRARAGALKLADRMLSSTEAVGRIAGIPVVAELVNAANRNGLARRLLDKTLGVDPRAPLPKYYSSTARRRLQHTLRRDLPPQAAGATRGQVVLFTTCYGNRNEPQLAQDLAAIFEHNGIALVLAARERCCGMPKLELGRPRVGGALQARQHPAAAQAGRCRLRHRGADSLVRADVQAGTAADVCRRRRRCSAWPSTCSIRSST